jgi:hypothetical protein
MTTSLQEIKKIERYILGQMPIEEKLVFEAQVLTNPVLKEGVFLQRLTYHIVKLYNRRKLKRQLENLHHKLLEDPTKEDFRKSIRQSFNQ